MDAGRIITGRATAGGGVWVGFAQDGAVAARGCGHEVQHGDDGICEEDHQEEPWHAGGPADREEPHQGGGWV